VRPAEPIAGESSADPAAMRCMTLSRRAFADLAEAVDDAGPVEPCGVLLGSTVGARIVVERILPLRNAFAGAGGFAISDVELRRATLAGRGGGDRIVGIYHGHPGGSPALSDGDRKSLARSSLPWVVVVRADDGPAGSTVRLAAYDAGTGSVIAVTRPRT
jgi:proteasome lid subunit RPN8/RPN11